jgi:hypothetical protein
MTSPNHSHPCDGHTCDHCYRCDVLGECCAQPSPVPVSATGTVQASLHDAIVHDAMAVISLPELVRCEAASHGALPAAVRLGLVAAADPRSYDSRKEATYAPRSRALR